MITTIFSVMGTLSIIAYREPESIKIKTVKKVYYGFVIWYGIGCLATYLQSYSKNHLVFFISRNNFNDVQSIFLWMLVPVAGLVLLASAIMLMVFAVLIVWGSIYCIYKGLCTLKYAWDHRDHKELYDNANKNIELIQIT